MLIQPVTGGMKTSFGMKPPTITGEPISDMGDATPIEIECLVVGAGVVGLAVGRALQLAGLQTFIVEAHDRFGMETSSRNSEVIHAGIYYPAGSLKADLCVGGRKRLYAYCEDRNVPHRRIGKLIVATCEAEVDTLEVYLAAARANGVDDLRWVEQAELREREPAVQAVRALHSPSTGIIDSHAYMQALLDDFEIAGGHLVRGTRIVDGEVRSNGILLRDASGDAYLARRLVNSAGLDAPNFASRIAGFPQQSLPQGRFAIGHYYVLECHSPFNQLVYPVAVAGGLGVHVTLDMGGAVRFGPDVRWIDEIDYTFDDSRREEFISAIRRYYPDLDANALKPGYTGIRPKIDILGAPTADFQIQGREAHGVAGLVNLFGIESPGLTSSLAIADRVVNLIY
jgi:L-2-hydroxyglutarate oxidase LhgO